MINEKVLGQFRKNLRGQLVSSKDNDYEDARKVWNGMIDKHPLFIVRCNDKNDVAQALNFARSNNLEIAVRGGGHNVAAAFGKEKYAQPVKLKNKYDPENLFHLNQNIKPSV
jgi:FAD/FMN-containing dehydrogenase